MPHSIAGLILLVLPAVVYGFNVQPNLLPACRPAVSVARPEAARSKTLAPLMNEAPDGRQVDLVDRASDPFRIVRTVLYVTFGVAGLAGCGIAISKGEFMNAAINAIVLGAGVGLFLFDRSITAGLREKAEKELSNPYLKGDLSVDAENDETPQ